MGSSTGNTGATGTTGVTGATGATGGPAGTIQFRDDFSDPATGWDVFDLPRTRGAYQDGKYALAVAVKPGPKPLVTTALNTSTPELQTITNARVAATGQLTISNTGLYGLICRAVDRDNYYYFLVQSDGTYYIGETVAGNSTNFVARFTPAINQGSGTNRIAAECVDGPQGVTLRMFVNEVAVNTVVDPNDPFLSGAVGFRVESVDANTEAAFDDLVVSATG